MPIVPNFVERLFLLKLNQGPGLILDFLGAQVFRTLCVAVKLGVFETLSNGPMSSPDIARQIKTDERGTTLLLEALEAIGYVDEKQARYRNTPMTTKWLLRNSPNSLVGALPFLESMVFERWGCLDESIRRGRPAVYGSEWLEQHPDGWRIYQEGMMAVAKMTADEVVGKVKLQPNASRLLDVGGNHGLYSIKFCCRYPSLSATVFDLPQALEVARENISAEKMDERIGLREGDFWTDPLGTGYDIALVFNILHAFLPDKNTELLHKVANALNPGGLVIIMDQIAGKASGTTAKALVRLQAMNYFNDLGARTCAFHEIAAWLTKTGFTYPRLIRLRGTPGFALVQGRKTQK